MVGASPPLAKRADSPTLAIVLSIGFHAALVGAWLIGRNSAPPIDLEAKPIVAHLVRLGEKKPDKLLPRKEANTPPPEPEATPIPTKATPAVAEPPKPKPPKAPPQKDLRKDLFAAFDKTKPVTKPDPVTGQADGDAAGDVETASEGEKYYGTLNSRIKRNYDVSSAITDSERVRLAAVIIIWIDSDGHVTKTEFKTKSGNDLFDSAVLGAVQKANPFPPPPDFLKSGLAKDGVELKFRP
jgi:colicin import membrane protein/protein TonB